jgi:hypothetical protein
MSNDIQSLRSSYLKLFNELLSKYYSKLTAFSFIEKTSMVKQLEESCFEKSKKENI